MDRGMKIACISNTHGRSFSIPKCDIFIHAGDITAGGSIQEMRFFAHWLSQQKQARHKVITFGNHDRCAEEFLDLVRAVFDPSVSVLVNESVEIEGVTLWGSPNTPPFMDWNFMSTEEELEEIYKSMPKKVDVLITHGPPFGILDPGWKVQHAGSNALLDVFLNHEIKIHVFGHLHGAGGKKSYQCGTKFYNVAACDEAYQLVNHPLILEI